MRKHTNRKIENFDKQITKEREGQTKKFMKSVQYDYSSDCEDYITSRTFNDVQSCS